MIRTLICIAILILLGNPVLDAQDTAQGLDTVTPTFSDREHESITATIELYFEGWMTGDTTKLGQAMHRTCQLKNIKDNDVIIYDRTKYLSFFKPRPRRENAGGEIISINVTDDIASAKCEIHTKDRLFTDYFNMMKLGKRWYIVDKIATNKARKKIKN